MDIKKFIRGASSGKVSASAYLAQYREDLTKGDHYAVVAPILQKVDAGELYPSPALTMMVRALVDYTLKVQAQPKVRERKATKPDAPYTCVVYGSDGEALYERGEDSIISAQRWSAGKLVAESDPHSYAVVYRGEGEMARFTRDQAFGLLDGRKIGQAYRKTGSNGGPWRMKAEGDRFHTSRG